MATRLHWIKMRVDLDRDEAVQVMACRLKVHELAIIGCLWKTWAWADQNVTEADPTTDLGPEWLDAYVSMPGFSEAMQVVGWLEIGVPKHGTLSQECPSDVPGMSQRCPTGLRFPNFGEWMGHASRTRTNETERKRAQRARQKAQAGKPPEGESANLNGTMSQNCPRNVPGQNGTMSHPETETESESKSKEKPPPTTRKAKADFDPTQGWPWQDQEFAAAVCSWVSHRRETGKPIRPTAHAEQVRKCREWGRTRSLAALRHSTAGSFQGLYEPSGGQNAKLDPVAAARETTRKFFEGEFDAIDALIEGAAQ